MLGDGASTFDEALPTEFDAPSLVIDDAVVSYNSVAIHFENTTGRQIVIEAMLAAEGEWIPGQEPVQQTQYESGSTVGPFATASTTFNEGNGGTIFTSVGEITWTMPWNGPPTLSVELDDSSLTAVPSEPAPNPYPDDRHVRYTFSLGGD